MRRTPRRRNDDHDIRARHDAAPRGADGCTRDSPDDGVRGGTGGTGTGTTDDGSGSNT
ncbi:hypothetical protein [Agromyces atrinae]|uniref:hypothetical protein n=1 Tax=Agromyces atrinae TaxID=592376 RepID=UPI0013E93657|nr:hypothetical protein [Agromyces atrinae]